MLGYILKRAISLIISLCLASIIIFAVVEIAPGDPASFMLGINAQDDTVAALRAELGLDQDKLSRYFTWVSGMIQGDFGTSYTYRSPVAEMIKERIWVSLPLALYALLISTLIAFPAGIYAATQRGKSGDLAVMHSDGYVKIQDRSKDIIISGGENISSIEIENTLAKHPSVSIAAVVAKPDQKWGEVPCAFIELVKDKPATEKELISFCKETLAGFKVPKQVIFCELPKTSTGKIQKFELRKKF